MNSIEELHNIFISSKGVTTDSRNCKEGTIFFALKGENFNGNLFAKSALEAGCIYSIIDEEVDFTDNRLILVESVLETLQNLANYHRRSLNTKLIGITGTNGKTTTKELIYAVCSSTFSTIATIGNLNNHIGVPLTLLRLTKETEIGIIEMGANHIGEIELLSKIASPNIGLITNVGKAHLEGFGSFEGVKKAKGELYDYLNNTQGEIILNSDNRFLIEMIGNRCYIPYSTSTPGTTVWCTSYKVTPFLEFEFKIAQAEDTYSLKTNLVGSYNLENILAAISIGLRLGISIEKICAAIENYSPSNNRSQLKKTEKNTLLVDCYNANPSSMMVAIANFREIEHPDKILILGEMLELGNTSTEEHIKLIDSIRTLANTYLYLVGKEFEKITDIPSNALFFQDSNALLIHLKETKLENKLILIKGSRGNRLEKTISEL